MTLVVARIETDDLLVHSDSMLSDKIGVGTERELSQFQPFSGTLKTVFLHRHVCLCFAGQSSHAFRFLKYFMTTNISDWTTERLVLQLADIHERTDRACEFIVCTAFNRTPKIYSVKDGSISFDLQNAWLGSADAFAAYQEAYHSAAAEPVHTRMATAFRSVIDNDAIEGVGHFHIQAYLDHHLSDSHGESVFLYEWKHESDIGNQVVQIEANTPTALPFGDAAHGAFGTSYFRSVSPIYHAVAIHFPHANLGVFWCPQIDCESAIVIRGRSAKRFLGVIWNRYSIPMEGMGVEDSKLWFIRNYRSG